VLEAAKGEEMRRFKTLVGVFSVLTLGFGCGADSDSAENSGADEPRNDREPSALQGTVVQGKAEALNGTIDRCYIDDLTRYEFNFEVGDHSNMQVQSGDVPELTDWWSRTDGCTAFVVDWVHDVSRDTTQAGFADGIVDPHLQMTPDSCALMQETRQVMAQYWSNGANANRMVSNLTWTSTWNEQLQRCDKTTNSLVWFGGTADYIYWFARQIRIRVAAQAFVWTLPVSTSAYLQTEGHGEDPGCPTNCCFGGDQSGCFN
jgi:hypothetical protein